MTLSDLETDLTTALSKALPPGTTISAGSPLAPDADTKRPAIWIFAAGLRTLPAAVQDGEGKREAAFLTYTYRFVGDGQCLDFALPEDAKGELAEVEMAPGRLARAGDQWWQKEHLLRFYRPPTGPFTAVLRGGPALGYRETVKGAVALVLTVVADQPASADALANTALAVVLSAFVGLDLLVLAEASPPGLVLRLRQPLAQLQGLERDTVAVGAARLHRSTTRLDLRGELEITLVAGTPEEESTIKRLEGTLAGAGKQPVTRNFAEKKG